MTDIVKSIGAGKDYADLASFFAAVPSNLVSVSERWIGQVYGNITVSVTQTLSARTTSALYNVIIEAAPGEGTDNPAFLNGPLYFDSSLGGSITSNGSSIPAIKIDNVAYTIIRNLQIKGNNTTIQQLIYLIGANAEISRNIFQSNATDSGVALLFQSANNLVVKNNLLVTLGTGTAGMSTDYSSGVTVTGNTFVAPNNTSNVGMFAQSGLNPVMKDNAIFGYTPPLNGASSSSSNNATNAASLVGTANQLNLVRTNQFTSTTDYRVKSGAAIIGTGVDVAGRTVDIVGRTVASPPSIGAAEFVVDTVTITGTVGNAGANGVSATVVAAAIIAGTVGSALADGVSSSVGNSLNCSIGDVTAGGLMANIASSTTIAGIKGNASCNGSTALPSNFITTSVLTNNTDSVLVSSSVNYTWYPLGRIGSMTGVTITEGSGTTNAQGKLVTTISHLTSGAGVLFIAHRNTSALDDDVAYEAFA